MRTQPTYDGKLYLFLLDGDHLILVLRQDMLALPGAKEAFQAKYGWEAGCPETVEPCEQLAEYFHTKKGETRFGKTFLPQELAKAAQVMGASCGQIFWRIELPLLNPVIVIAVVIRGMEALKLFDSSVLLTFGGPGTATQTIAFYLWRQVWQFNKYSFGAAASIPLLLLFAVVIYSGIFLLVWERARLRQEGNV